MNGQTLRILIQLSLLTVFLNPSLAGQTIVSRDSEEPLYVIQPNDVLEVFVWREPELSRKVVVRPDGRISFPLLQDIQAAGTSPPELGQVMTDLLTQYLEAPNVTVIVEEIRNYRVYVTGQVNNPSAFTVERPITVLQALSLAGGFQEYADQSEIKIHRTYGAETVIFRFNYKEVIKGKNENQNVFLRSGDVVVVP